jgi:hypothetical protein
MRKSPETIMKFSACLVFFICGACAPRYEIKYDKDPPIVNSPGFAKNRLGICVFEDKRPSMKPDYKFFQDTWTITDDVLEQKPPEIINKLMVNHFNAAFGNISSALKIEQKCSAANIKELIAYLHDNGSVDFLMVGTISQYTSSIYDKNATARGILGFIPGMVLLFDENVVSKTDMELDNIMLIKVDGPQIVWKGSYKNTTVEPVRILADRYENLVQMHAKNTKKALQAILDSILLSADKGFPQKYSDEDSKRIINKIKINKTLSDPGKQMLIN